LSNLAAGGTKGLRAVGRAFAPRRAIDLAQSDLAFEMFSKPPSVLEAEMAKISDPFMKMALSAAFELGPEALAKTVDLEMEAQRASFEEDAQIWEHTANAADAWGAMGALAGFMLAAAFKDEKAVMFSLGCAIWGMALSRLALWPMALRIRAAGSQRLVAMQLAAEAVVSRASGAPGKRARDL
jgi:flagellar motor component MotA